MDTPDANRPRLGSPQSAPSSVEPGPKSLLRLEVNLIEPPWWVVVLVAALVVGALVCIKLSTVDPVAKVANGVAGQFNEPSK